MVFQSYALFPHLSVAENIVFGLRVRRVSRAERDARLKRVADIVGLGQLLERKPSQLSGGQRQRVALGRAIIAEARVCLMDEPLSNLDAKLRHEMRTEIRALQQRLGMTMVYVTHDQTEAMTMADRVVLMRDGRIEQNGTPEELYNRPATAFTARFIGTPPMNLIARDDRLIGIRPEHIRLVSQDGHAARVKSVEHLGADSIVLCEIEGQPVSVRQDGFSKAHPGDDVRLAWDAGARTSVRSGIGTAAGDGRRPRRGGLRLAETGTAASAAARIITGEDDMKVFGRTTLARARLRRCL